MNDLKYATRQLFKSPGFTAVAVISLALGIGANTAIFSMINAVLLRSLPVPDPHELRVVNWTGRNPVVSHYAGDGFGSTLTGMRYGSSFSYPAYSDFRDQCQETAEVFAFYRLSEITSVTRGYASVAEGLMVSGNFFKGYGTSPSLGRPISPEDDQLAAAPVAVITHQWWEEHFDRDPDVLGEAVILNQHSFTVIGVLPEDHVGPLVGDPTDIYVPLSAQPVMVPWAPLNSPRHWWVQIMARIAPGAGVTQVQAQLAVLFPQALATSDTRMEQPGIWLEDGSRGPLMTRHRVARPMWALLIVVGAVLFIACANLASLMLARGMTRRHEMSVRAALGAGRWRLMRQSLAESLLLALGGGGLGFLLAWWGKAGQLKILGDLHGDLNFETGMDLKVLAFALGTSLVTALLFGLLPAFRAARVTLVASLQDRSALGSPRLRMGRVLVALQIGLSMVLVVSASLVVQTFFNLHRAHPGFRTENLLLFRLNPGQAGYEKDRLVEIYEEVTRSLKNLPGVHSASCSSLALVGGEGSYNRVPIPGGAVGGEDSLQTATLVVNDTFFATVGLPMKLGRAFNPGDLPLSNPVVVVNETFARLAFGEESPVGRSLHLGEQEHQIVGVCHDASYQDLRGGALPTLYYSHRQSPAGAMYFEVRSGMSPLSLVPAVRQAIAAIDPTLPLTDLKTQRQQIEQSISPDRIIAMLCGILALLAVLLSCIGIYGLMAYSVSCRTGEIGIRMALGAAPWGVARTILREALKLAVTGLGGGMILAFGLAQIIRHYLFGIQPHDPLTLLGGAALMAGVVLLAAWLPARRATRVDPLNALRME